MSAGELTREVILNKLREEKLNGEIENHLFAAVIIENLLKAEIERHVISARGNRRRSISTRFLCGG